MSATNKTSYLGLCSWLGSDKPQRADFNSDNAKIDQFASEHASDMQLHLSEEDREKLQQSYYFGVYFGNNSTSRTVSTGCPFTPTFGIVFAISTPPSITRFDTQGNYNYFAFISQRGGTTGASFSGSDINVVQSASAESYNEYANLNTTGKTYCYILFR